MLNFRVNTAMHSFKQLHDFTITLQQKGKKNNPAVTKYTMCSPNNNNKLLQLHTLI